jgi:hypothetical protein
VSTDLSPPPAKPGTWTFEVRYPDGMFKERYRAANHKSWAAARLEAAVALRCEPGDVVCVGRPT